MRKKFTFITIQLVCVLFWLPGCTSQPVKSALEVEATNMLDYVSAAMNTDVLLADWIHGATEQEANTTYTLQGKRVTMQEIKRKASVTKKWKPRLSESYSRLKGKLMEFNSDRDSDKIKKELRETLHQTDLVYDSWQAEFNNDKAPPEAANLVIAASKGNLSKVRFLLSSGIDPNSGSELGITALHAASMKGHTEIVSALLINGADINMIGTKGITALILASTYGHIEVVKELLDQGAEVSIKTESGASALDKALQKGHTEIAKMLRAHGATE